MQRLTLHSGVLSDAGFGRNAFSDIAVNTCVFAIDGSGGITTPAAHNLQSGQKVRFTTTGALPIAINTILHYFVRGILSSTRFTVSLTGNGADIVYATVGTGTHSVLATDLGIVKGYGNTSGGPHTAAFIVIDDYQKGGILDNGEVWFADGFVGHYYEVREESFGINAVASIFSGSLPPGLSLVNLAPDEWAIRGTPTTPGAYDWVLQGLSAGGAIGHVLEHMTVLADPDEGVGAVGGG